MASPIVEKVLDRLDGEASLKILESNFNTSRPKLWARAKELAEERFGVYGVKAHSWAYKWYQQKGGVFEENKPDYLDFDKDGDKKESMKKALKDKKKKGHDCASKVKHEEYGIGNCIKGMHTLDEYNKVTHYDVEFEEYIVENVPVDHLEILEGMYHEHTINHDKNREVHEGVLGAASGAVLGGAVGGPLGAAAGAALGSKVDVLGKKKAKVTTGSQKVTSKPEEKKDSNTENEAAKAAKRARLAKAIERDKLQREHHQKDADGNTIPHEEIEEAATTRIPAQNGNVYELMYSWRGKTYYCKMFFPQPNKPSKGDVEVALNKVYPSSILRNYYISAVNYGDPYIHVGQGDGFTDK